MKTTETAKHKRLVLGLPKGSLQDATFELMGKAGFAVEARPRSYFPEVDDPDISARLIRAQEIARYVELGMLDAGITGLDWIKETDAKVVEVAELVYAKQGLRPVRWVLAVPANSRIHSVKDLRGKRIATEAVGMTTRYLKKHGVKATVEFSWGATEVKAPELVDAVVELTETGSSLRAANLRIIETVLESTTRLVANKVAWKNPWKRRKIEQLAILLLGALRASSKVLLKMNVRSGKLAAVSKILPSLHAPTVSRLADEDWVAVETVVDENVVKNIILSLKRAGAEGIIELPLSKVIP